jgi:hypothetical protein
MDFPADYDDYLNNGNLPGQVYAMQTKLILPTGCLLKTKAKKGPSLAL